MSQPAPAQDLSELIRKVDQIYVALFGLDGQPNTGRLTVLENRVEGIADNHGKRILSLEKWQSRAIGAASIVVIIVEIIRVLK